MNIDSHHDREVHQVVGVHQQPAVLLLLAVLDPSEITPLQENGEVVFEHGILVFAFSERVYPALVVSPVVVELELLVLGLLLLHRAYHLLCLYFGFFLQILLYII